MSDSGELLRVARERYFAEDEKYKQRYTLTGQAIVDDFLNKLGARQEAQSDLLQQLAGEARQEIVGFTGVQTRFAVLLGDISLAWQGLSLRAQKRVLEEALERDAKAVQATGGRVSVAFAHETSRLVSALNGAAGLIAMRRATLEQFRRSHLLATWEQIREQLQKGVGDELKDAFSDEVAEQIVDLLIKHGGEAGKAVADQVPVLGAAAKLAKLFYDATRAPEKFATVGGADLLLMLVSAMRKERAMFEAFEEDLESAFDAVQTAL